MLPVWDVGGVELPSSSDAPSTSFPSVGVQASDCCLSDASLRKVVHRVSATLNEMVKDDVR
jgi:hypothetical protein